LASPRRITRSRGFTIIELLVVAAILGLVLGTAVYGFRALTKSELRGSAAKLAGAIRYCFDRAVTSNAYYRIVLDLDGNKYWAERSEERFYLAREKENSPGRGQAFDVAAEEAKREQEHRDNAAQMASLPGGTVLEPPPQPKRAKFQTFMDAALPSVNLGRARLFDVFTPRQREPYTKGRAYLYFFPDGHTENAVVLLTDGDAYYSLVVHPLAGRVEVMSGKYEIGREFGERDDEGRSMVPR
jgi:general secretion pathway protein H